eukprot:364418-Chlamydomonas_euryale.AAC.12
MPCLCLPPSFPTLSHVRTVAGTLTVRPQPARQFLNTSFDTTSSFFWSSPCVRKPTVLAASPRPSDRARAAVEGEVHGSGSLCHAMRMAAHLDVLEAGHTGEVADAGTINQASDLLASQRGGGNDDRKLVADGAGLLQLRWLGCNRGARRADKTNTN